MKIKFFKARVFFILVASGLAVYQAYHSKNPWLLIFIALSQVVMMARDYRNVQRGGALRK